MVLESILRLPSGNSFHWSRYDFPVTEDLIGRKYVPPKEPIRSTCFGDKFGRNSARRRSCAREARIGVEARGGGVRGGNGVSSSSSCPGRSAGTQRHFDSREQQGGRAAVANRDKKVLSSSAASFVNLFSASHRSVHHVLGVAMETSLRLLHEQRKWAANIARTHKKRIVYQKVVLSRWWFGGAHTHLRKSRGETNYRPHPEMRPEVPFESNLFFKHGRLMPHDLHS